MKKTNSLSRKLVKPKWLEIRRIETVEIVVEGVNLLEQVK